MDPNKKCGGKGLGTLSGRVLKTLNNYSSRTSPKCPSSVHRHIENLFGGLGHCQVS